MAESETRVIQVEVVYARPDEQVLLAVDVPLGTTVQEAIHASGILAQFPEIDLASNKVGIFGKQVTLDYALAARDRVEIYRPLIADPKDVRRRLAQEGKTMGRSKT